MMVFSSYWTRQVGKGNRLQVELVAVPEVLLAVIKEVHGQVAGVHASATQ